MKRLLITGLTGKSGIVFAERLAEEGLTGSYAVRAAVRPASDTARLRELLPEAELCPGVLEDGAYLEKLTRGADVLFHIAGIHWSLPLVRAAAENGVRRMILVHTTGIYSRYKAAGEEYRQIDAAVYGIAEEGGIGLTILRPTMIYGTLEDGNVVEFIKMVDKLSPMPVVSHGRYLLQPVHAADLGRAYCQVLCHLEETAGKDYILSGRDPVLLMDLFRMIAEELGVRRRFLSVPFPAAYAGAWGLYLLSLTRADLREKVQRLCEDRAFPHEEAVRDFGYDPMPFEEGLRGEVRAYLERTRGRRT
ncbi:NAD(P)-dependent oxidoreductase [uncultured Oscillibacter sp.]|uniref:NAD-dependent epimerase/dehydratase family protein n=1 Tax=uncultured Oscillibacter sp. TaxID=876091 RepID=UPI0025F7D78A|nr:NAD(P)H-binding protein [uncultured Oscillibacter sp.]